MNRSRFDLETWPPRERLKERGFDLSHETDRYRELPDHFAENILVFERIDGPR
jgi:hypothetical protein